MKDKSDSLSFGDRMKRYESVSDAILTSRLPKIIRIDGKSFHTYTRGFERPFDNIMTETWFETAKYLCNHIMGAKIAYFQSDELSILINDYEKTDSQSWFNNRVQKIVSVSSSMATAAWNRSMLMRSASRHDGGFSKIALFDSRVFVLPKEEVANYFIWRQQDCIKNSVNQVANSFFTHEELMGLNSSQKQELLFSKRNINWSKFPNHQKNGSCLVKHSEEKYDISEYYSHYSTNEGCNWVLDLNIPIFTQDREYIEKYI